MINKQGLWFLSLFSLILVLGIYYITMPSEMFLTNNGNVVDNNNTDNNDNSNKVSSTIDDSNYITALKVELDSKRDEELTKYKNILNSSDASIEDKNNAYLQIKNINNNKGLEETLEKKIKTNFNLNAYVEINNNEVSVVIDSKTHDVSLANEIMRLIQKEFTQMVSISVKFS